MIRKLKTLMLFMLFIVYLLMTNSCAASKNKHKGYEPCPCEKNK
jgi:hypothetical protein